jgi:hypothetical protein
MIFRQGADEYEPRWPTQWETGSCSGPGRNEDYLGG